MHGPEDARTLVLVHCWVGTQELWHKQVDALAGKLRIVTYDHRGHGISDPAPDNDYSLAALALDLDAVIEATVPDDEPPLIAGHSMGAMTLAAWADSCTGEVPNRASGVALMSAGLEGLGLEAQVVRALPGPFDTFRGKLADIVVAAPGAIRATPIPLAYAVAAYAALGPSADREDIELAARMALDTRARARAGCGRAMAQMNLSHAAEVLDVPAIVIAGAKDLLTPIAHAERIETALPASLGLRVDPEAGHMTPLESPDLVNDALRELAAATKKRPPKTAASPPPA